MNEEAAFEAAILANPKDQTVRLVFADWLDEHDQPERAAALRAAIEAARRPPPTPPPPPRVDSSRLNSLDPADIQRDLDALVDGARRKLAHGGSVNIAEAFFLELAEKAKRENT